MALIVEELFQAIFITELKNRFICEVEIDGKAVECYVPSSCRLANFLDLSGKQVLVKKNITPKARTQYALFAVPYKQSYLLLNSSLANRVVEKSLHERRFSFLGKRTQIFKEFRIEDYKTDLYLAQSKTIVEIKSIISTNKSAVFPTVYSERAIQQLKLLKLLLQNGYKVCYIIISLNPYVKEISIDMNSRLFPDFSECKALGMQLKGFSCRLTNNQVVIDKEISIH